VYIYFSYLILNKITFMGYHGHLWTSGGSNHGVRAVFTIIIILEYFATEFRSYPPLKVIYHPAGFYNSPMSFLWKTHCIIIALFYDAYTLYLRWTHGAHGDARQWECRDLIQRRLTGTRLSADAAGVSKLIRFSFR